MKTRGINHLAMVTNDMEKTVRFYRDVMGFPLVGAIGNDPNGLRARHYFFETGPNSTIAFFEWEGAEDFTAKMRNSLVITLSCVIQSL